MNDDIKLPSGYVDVKPDSVQPQQIVELRESVGWSGDTVKRWTSCLKQNLYTVCVENSNGQLVGMGCVAGNNRHAVLCDFAVHPDHQHKGIGRYILAKRLDFTDANNIPYLYAELSQKNPFRDYLKDVGFVETGNGLFRAHSYED